MKDVLDFMSGSPFTTICILMSASYVVGVIFLRLPNRVLRHWNIRKHGYPPPHCDADGDFKPEPEEEDAA